MEETIDELLSNPTVGKIVAAVVAVLIIVSVSRLARRSIGRLVKDVDTGYLARKLVNFVGYFVAFLATTVVFSDKPVVPTVAFGIAGAGVAFAFQEMLASIAGWAAISLGGVYSTGDRVQTGGDGVRDGGLSGPAPGGAADNSPPGHGSPVGIVNPCRREGEGR
jgi:small-conductance mechanosensitive channel